MKLGLATATAIHSPKGNKTVLFERATTTAIHRCVGAGSAQPEWATKMSKEVANLWHFSPKWATIINWVTKSLPIFISRHRLRKCQREALSRTVPSAHYWATIFPPNRARCVRRNLRTYLLHRMATTISILRPLCRKIGTECVPMNNLCLPR